MHHTGATPVSARCYARVSTEEQAVSGYSLSAQREQLQRCLDRLDWRCAGWYIDEGKSAKDLNRPEFQRMMREAARGDVILVTRLDRLTRSIRDLDDLLREFDRRGLSFQSVTEQFETRTPGGRLYMGIIAVIAQWEREIIADRSATGKKQKVVLGEWSGGPVPFGYRGAPSGRLKRGRELLQLVPDPLTAPTVTAIFERYVSGQGLRAICTWLNDEARVPTAHHARWRVSSLSRLLTNPLYVGYVSHGRRKGTDVILTKGTHPPLVSEELFAAARRTFETRRTMAPRQATGTYPLAGIARCGVCGGRIDAASRRRQATYVYRCRNYGGGIGCGKRAARSNSGTAGHIVEGLLVEAMDGVSLPQYLNAFLHSCREEQPSHTVTTRLQSQRARAEQAIRQWEAAFEEGRIDWDDLQQRTRHHRQTVLWAEQQLQKTPAPPPRAELASSVISLRRAWEHLHAHERKAMLQEFTQAYGVRILLYPGRRIELAPI
ncbi:MAG TPA: recombinase family protein [Symbiobacteriaceae bacterium]|nr:recombinase family protein [Symbiobacteriaceae bacterium]